MQKRNRVEYHRQYRLKHGDALRAKARQKYAENPQAVIQKVAAYRNRIKYNLTSEAYEAMVRHQENRCGICGVCMTNGRSGTARVVDHNKHTGRVRALLCSNCNRCIGLAKEDPFILKRALQYVTYHAKLDKKGAGHGAK